jgi:pSer/pThr/pTyr-binding forkhead associated (FHA) protein
MAPDTRKLPERHNIIPLQSPTSGQESSGHEATSNIPEALKFQVWSSDRFFTVSVRENMMVGRRDPSHGISPDVDLEPFKGYQLGVSRRHAMIFSHRNTLFIRSLNTTNGTCVNGRWLSPGQEYPLSDGDELMFGGLELRVVFEPASAPA